MVLRLQLMPDCPNEIRPGLAMLDVVPAGHCITQAGEVESLLLAVELTAAAGARERQ